MLSAFRLDGEAILRMGRRRGGRGDEDSRSEEKDDENDEGTGTRTFPEPISFLHELCLPVLLSSRGCREAFLRLAVLSPAVAVGLEKDRPPWLVPRIIVQLLSAMPVEHESVGDAHREEDDEGREDEEVGGNFLCVCLKEASEMWSESVYVQMTDESQQVYVTEFILASVPCLQQGGVDSALRQKIVLALVEGVTARLESSRQVIRRQGMLVAEVLAPLLGQTLRFEELHGDSGDARREHGHSTDCEAPAASKETSNLRVEADLESNDAADDDNSVWSEDDLVPYDLEDDESDLATVNQPKYLRDCLALLRSPETDKNAFDATRAALKQIESLVRIQPHDLADMAGPLAQDLLFIEDKFQMEDFVALRWRSLCALLVHEPIIASRIFTQALFGSTSLGIRLDILGLYESAAEELCGSTALQEARGARSLFLQHPSIQSKVSGKRRLVHGNISVSSSAKTPDTVASKRADEPSTENRTRRWGRGYRRPAQMTVTNKFGPIAHLWFYPLVAGWAQTKGAASIWGGSNGARLLATFLVTLARIVESSGNHPGTAILALDLFELVWPFRDAEIPEVRMAVLVAIATCCPFLPPEFMSRNLYEEKCLASFLTTTLRSDADVTCREIATALTKNVLGANILPR